MTSKCGKNEKVAYEAQPSVSLMFLPHFDVIGDLLLRLLQTYSNMESICFMNKETKGASDDVIYASVL